MRSSEFRRRRPSRFAPLRAPRCPCLPRASRNSARSNVHLRPASAPLLRALVIVSGARLRYETIQSSVVRAIFGGAVEARSSGLPRACRRPVYFWKRCVWSVSRGAPSSTGVRRAQYDTECNFGGVEAPASPPLSRIFSRSDVWIVRRRALPP